PAAGAPAGRKHRLEDETNALLAHRILKRIAQVFVEAAQDLGAAIDQRHLAAEAVEDVREFERDVAAADDGDALGQRLQMERVIGRDAVLDTFGFGLARGIAAGGDEDGSGGDVLVGAHQVDRVSVLDDRTIVDDHAAGAFHRAAVVAVQALELFVLVGDQGGPVERRVVDRPAVTDGVLELFRKGGGVDEELLRNAAAMNAGAAEAGLL